MINKINIFALNGASIRVLARTSLFWKPLCRTLFAVSKTQAFEILVLPKNHFSLVLRLIGFSGLDFY